MKTTSFLTLLTGAALLLTAALASARDFGVSSRSAGRGTVYNTSRGGEAYVGPRGFAAQGANGREAASGRYGSAYSGPNVTAASGRYGAAYSGPNSSGYVARGGTAVATGGYVRTGGVAAGGYVRTIPAGAQTVVYHGASCYYVGGVYYQPVVYGGEVVYVVVP